MDEEESALNEGMPVKNEEGEDLGTLGALLIDADAEEDDEAEFLVLRTGNVDRLVPFDAVLGVGDGNLVLDVPAANVTRFPAIQPDADPTEKQMETAYEVYDEGASEVDEDED